MRVCMADASYLRLQVIVFALVSASFTNIYITQPVLPVLGRMGGRLLGGWIYPPLHWRYAFVSASILILIATFAALRGLPRTPVAVGQRERSIGFLELLKHWEYLRLYFCAAGSFAIFSPIFNYLPFRLNGPPFRFSTELTTLVYLV